MSILAATQIPKPTDEQAFERASLVLWEVLLKDPTVQLNGRRGQKQNGVDIFGRRNGDPDRIVGIQCKLKTDGHFLTKKEIRAEVEKAKLFRPPLAEYFIITTAPDDVTLQELARELTAESKQTGGTFPISVWGWNTLEEKIRRDPIALKAFDPTCDLYSERIFEQTQTIEAQQNANQKQILSVLTELQATLMSPTTILAPLSDDTSIPRNAFEAHLDADIDTYREMALNGTPSVALSLLAQLLDRVSVSASGRLLFRIKANIGMCLLKLGQDDEAAKYYLEAHSHAPEDPKAIANKGLALLLMGDLKGLLQFGEQALRKDPTNACLAGYLINAASLDLTITDPDALVPDPIKGSAPVMISYIDFKRRRGGRREWWSAAENAAQAHPNDPRVKRLCAEATLDRILDSEAFQRRRLLTLEQRHALQNAVTVLSEQWGNVQAADGIVRQEDIALCTNLALALHTLGDRDLALDVAREGLQVAPNDSHLVTLAAAIAFEHDDALFQQLLPSLPDGPHSTLLRLQAHASQANWSEVSRLCENLENKIPPEDRVLISAVCKLAKISTLDRKNQSERLNNLFYEVGSDARAAVLVADYARTKGFSALSEQAFGIAYDLVGAESHFSTRQMVAHHAALRGEWTLVADLLNHHVDEGRDNEHLRLLAQALAHETPIRQRAVSFFSHLPQDILNTPFYLRCSAHCNYNHGSFHQAEIDLRKVITLDPTLDDYLALVSILRRENRDSEWKHIVTHLTLEELGGSSVRKMEIAQLLGMAGDPHKAISFAYDVLCSARNDPKVALMYFGLLMISPDQLLIPATPRVETDTWIRLESDDGRYHSFLILDSVGRPADNVINPAHPIAAGALGLKTGDSFDVPAGHGNPRRWRVVEIKHKYLHALHDIMENFETRFPDANGFYSFKVSEGDITPILDQVKRASEVNRKLSDLYLIHNFPLHFVAAMMGGDPASLSHYVRSLDFDIRTCIGTSAERSEANSTISEARHAGAVLDLFTAWTVATLDAFDVLLHVFGRLFVPCSVIDELRTAMLIHEPMAADSLSVSWVNGEYRKQEYSAEDVARQSKYVTQQIAKIEQACQLRPVTAPDDLSESAELIAKHSQRNVLDPAFLSSQGYVLISEDLNFRQVAEDVCSVKGTWLQPIFSLANREGRIDDKRYIELTGELAQLRHSHIAIDARMLLGALNQDRSDNLISFRNLSRFIGIKNAEMGSHLEVSISFFNAIWRSSSRPSLKEARATGILLEMLTRDRPRDWAGIVVVLTQRCGSRFEEYVENWVIGHFLCKSELSREKEMILRG